MSDTLSLALFSGTADKLHAAATIAAGAAAPVKPTAGMAGARIGAWASLIDRQSTALQVFAVQSGDCSSTFWRVGHLDKSKST